MRSLHYNTVVLEFRVMLIKIILVLGKNLMLFMISHFYNTSYAGYQRMSSLWG